MHPPPPPLRTMMTCPSASNGRRIKTGMAISIRELAPFLSTTPVSLTTETDMSAVIKSLLSKCDMGSSPPTASAYRRYPLGSRRYAHLRDGRSAYPLWFARRLHVPEVWGKVRSMMRSRPAAGLRIVLTSTLGTQPAGRNRTASRNCSCVRRARTWRGACCGRRHTCRTDQQSIRPRRRTHPTCGGVRLGGDQRQTI